MSEWLAPALESCLWQSHKDIEVLVVDDGSADNSAEIATAYAALDPRIRVISQANSGLGATRQRGQDEASGDFITWLDADDFLDRHGAANWLGAASDGKVDLVCGNAVVFSNRNFNARRYFYHPPATNLHFDAAPRYWKSKVVWRWVFSLPMIRSAGIKHVNYKLGQDVCFMFEVFLRARRFTQVAPYVYYFRQGHKSSHVSLEVQLEHAFAHFIDVKQTLLSPPDGRPRIKPLVKYLNENYWRDVKKTAPRLATVDPAYTDRMLALGLELFSGLDPEWFRARALAPEVKEERDFLPWVDALTGGDVAAAKNIIASLQEQSSPTPDKRGFLYDLRYTLKSAFNPLSHTARTRLRQLEARVAERKSVPKPEPVQRVSR